MELLTILKGIKVDTLSYKTISVNKATAQKEWVVVDATDQVIGRLGTKVAKLLRGKYKPSFTPNVDGSRILYTNAEGALYSQAIGAAPVRLCDSIFGNVCGVTLDDAFYFFCAEGQLWVSDNGEAPRLVREGVTEVLLDCHTAYFLADVGDNGNGNIYANNRNRRSDEQIVTAARYMR